MYSHDPDLPAGCQDVDLEYSALCRSANREARLRKAGHCPHGWRQGPPGPPGKPTTVWTCLDCGAVFATEADIEAARREALI